MSYGKAMKHWRNIRKCKKQKNMYFGFDCCDRKTPSIWSNPAIAARMNIRNWFPDRNNGDADSRRRYREIIREEIAIARSAN